MENICNDNIVYYYILNSSKIIKSTTITIIVIGLITILFFIIKYKKNKEKKIIKKKLIKELIILFILTLILIILIVLSHLANNDQRYKNCLEKEELEALKTTPAKKETIVEIRKEEEKEIEPVPDGEEIEVVEDNGESAKEYEEKDGTLDITNKENAVYFLNVGAGTEAIIIQDDGKYGLIDTSYNSKASFIIKQLKKIGCERLDFILITHAHLDHIGGFKKIISKIPVDTLYIKNPGNVNSNYIPTYYDIINAAEKENITICSVDQELCREFLLGNINIKLFNTEFFNSKGITDYNRSRMENANSITALATINNKKVYFASDIGDYFDVNIETKTSELVGDVDVYKVAHHGYVTYNNNLVSLSYLKPEYNIITNSEELSLESVRRLKNTSPDYQKTYYTSNGTVTLHITYDGNFEFKQ